MSRGDDIDMRAGPRPFPRRIFMLCAFGLIIVLLTWVIVAITTLLSAQLDLGTLCPLVVTGLFLVFATFPLVLARSRSRRGLKGWLARNEEGLALLRAGRYDDAAEIWQDLAGAARWTPAVHVLMLHNLGVATLHRGRPDEAIAMMDSALDSGWIRGGPLSGTSTNVDVAKALAHAVAGDLEGAEKHRRLAGAKLPESRRGVTMLVDTMIAARRGTLGDPPTQDQLRLAEAAIMPIHVRAIPVLHAFAKTGGDGSYRSADGDAPASEGGGIAPGDLDFLAVRWPELAAYLRAQGLSL